MTIALGIIATGLTLHAQMVFDAAADFSTNQNPNGAWSYGWFPPTSTAFTLYPDVLVNPIAPEIQQWHMAGLEHPTDRGVVGRKLTDNPFDARFAFLSPGSSGERGVLRWTAPTAGIVDIMANFQFLSSEDRDVHIWARGGEALLDFDFRFVPSGPPLPPGANWSGSLLVEAGDTIDFFVGAAGFLPSTYLWARLTLLSGVYARQGSYRVQENAGEAIVEVWRTEPGLNDLVTVNYCTVDGVARAGEDYSAVSGSLTFLAGQTNQQIRIPILNDGIVEEDEHLSVQLSIPAENASLGRSNCVVVIEDNDLGIGFTSASVTASERIGEVVLTVRRQDDGIGAVSVDYTTLDQSAKAGEEYTALSGSLTFPAGTSDQQIRIPILNDAKWEGNEEFAVQLYNLTGAASLASSNCVVVIEDNDLAIGFTDASVTASESFRDVVLTVRRQDDGTGPVTVDYATADESARAGEDYTAVSGKLTFPARQRSQQVRIPLLDDTAPEIAETFRVRLSHVVGDVNLGPVMETVVKVLSNEHVTLYVAGDSSAPRPPYSTWATAATNIQDAIDLATDGDTVLVTNGVYGFGGRDGNKVAVTNAIRLESVNGPSVTTIDGGGERRCMYLGTNAVLSGFTLTNGGSYRGDRWSGPPPVEVHGGGIYAGAGTVVSNCVVANCVAGYLDWSWGFPPSWLLTSAVSGGRLYDCIIEGNPAGGAVGSTLYDCTLGSNSGSGASGCSLYRCLLTGNGAGSDGVFHNCTVAGNQGALSGLAYDCIVAGNSGGSDGTFFNCAIRDNQDGVHGTAYNCVLTGNGGGSHGAFYSCTILGNQNGISGTAYNSILYYNSGGNYAEGTTLNYCCTHPLPTNGVGNITGPPLFRDLAEGDYRLREDSPCLDAGTNLLGVTWTRDTGIYDPETGGNIILVESITDPTDILGNSRFIDGNGDGTVAWDIGAYEFNSFKPPRFAVHPQRTQDGWKLNVTGAPNKWARLQRSSNLRDWEEIWSGWMGSEGSAQVNDWDTGSTVMFYRVVVP